MRLCGERPFATVWAAKMGLRLVDPSLPARVLRRDHRIWHCATCSAWHADGVPRTGDTR